MPTPPASSGRPPGDRRPPAPRPQLPVIDEARPATPRAASGRLRIQDADALEAASPTPAAPPTASADRGTPVNPVSRAVDPRRQFPMHLDFLLRDLFARKEEPEQWQIVAADEVRLDELHMDVAFTIVHRTSATVARRVVEVQAGKLVRIRDA